MTAGSNRLEYSDNIIVTYIAEGQVEEIRIYKDEYIYELLGEKIKLARKQKNMSKKELGDLIGVTEEIISQIETKAEIIGLDIINQTLEVLNIKFEIRLELKE